MIIVNSSRVGKNPTYLDRKNVKGWKTKLNVDANRPEIPIKVDRDQIRKLNASTYQVGMALRKSLLGQDVSTYTTDGETHDIVIRFDNSNRNNINSLLDHDDIQQRKTHEYSYSICNWKRRAIAIRQ